MAARTIWTGRLQISRVTIPVKVSLATETTDGLMQRQAVGRLGRERDFHRDRDAADLEPACPDRAGGHHRSGRVITAPPPAARHLRADRRRARARLPTEA